MTDAGNIDKLRFQTFTQSQMYDLQGKVGPMCV